MTDDTSAALGRLKDIAIRGPRTGTIILGNHARTILAHIAALEARADEAEASIEAAIMAAAETQPSWGWRFSAIMSALGSDFGGPDVADQAIIADVSRQIGYEREELEARAKEAEARAERAEKCLREPVDNTGDYSHPAWKLRDEQQARAEAAEAREAALREALEKARAFIESEYRDPAAEPEGEWLAAEARPVHAVICQALVAYAALARQMGESRHAKALKNAEELVYERGIADGQVSSVVLEVYAERQRQINEEGWTPAHDDLHVDGELGAAAAAMIVHAVGWTQRLIAPVTAVLWPWSLEWWKPKNPRRDLIRAAALIIAELERLDRKS